MSAKNIHFNFCLTYFDQFVRERYILVTEWPADLNAARTLAGSLFTENVDVEDIILKFRGKEICCDEDWDVIVNGLKAEREVDKNARAAIRVFPVDVGRRK